MLKKEKKMQEKCCVCVWCVREREREREKTDQEKK